MTEVTVVIPTLNEAENLKELVFRLDRCLAGIDWEVVFVDDNSPDGTADEARNFARSCQRVRCIQRIGRRGLASACLEGILSSSSDYVAVMDADLQHDESLLPTMLATLKSEPIDIVIGSRYTKGGGLGEWSRVRAWMSRAATWLSHAVLRAKLQDPMSGYFMIRHEVALQCIKAGVSGIGFKVLLDLFASAPNTLRFTELPYHFRPRFAGQTKVDAAVIWEYFMLLADKLVGRWLPLRFLGFSMVGSVGVLVHFAVLGTLFHYLRWSFFASQTAATGVAMTSNFLLNNLFTYRDLRLKGSNLLWGWFTFALASSIGSLATIGIAEFLVYRKAYWVTAAFAGVAIGAVWNYVVTSIYTWSAPIRRSHR